MNGIELLGATLLHFLWQGILIAAVYAAARRCTDRPEVRYLLGCAALVVMAAAPAATWATLRLSWSQAVGAAASLPAPYAASAAAGFRGEAPRFFGAGYDGVPSGWLPWVVAAWAAGVVAFGVRLLGGWMVAQRIRRRQVRPASGQWQEAFDELRARVRVSPPVRLLVSGLAPAPAVVGLLRPVVLVPAGALAGLPAEQMEALLLHELAHIRRYDYLVNALQSMVEALLFYHPAVWWVSGHMRSERELCCDDAAVAVTGDPQSYARALAEIGLAAHAHYQAVVAATGGSLANRVARLLGEPRPASRTYSPAAVAAAPALIAITVMAALGLAARPQFEAASIKPAVSHGFAQMRPLPGRFTANAPLRVLMEAAYHVQHYQIEGGPEWIGSEQYEVDAKAAGNPERAQIFLMLQSLLEDRFRLQIHRESREMPVYALVAARGGLKLPAPREGGCVEEPEPLPPLPEPGDRMPPPGQSPAPARRCGGLGVALEAGGARLSGGKVSMAEFVRGLSQVLGRTVNDRTGFSGLFDVTLQFLPDDTTPGLPPPPPGAIPDAIASPSIFSAVQQMGLRLESTKGPVEVLVIDHVERPSAN
ncbi:MAG TPA: M56 family metallopeptidase [Bryobacteraceae bacterium]|nr:M56 family metallopeptidase [Bryobacteraceae bacterium]